MPRYMVIIKGIEDTEGGVMPTGQLLTDMGNFNEELVKAGVVLAMEGLAPISRGAKVRFSGTKSTVIDGPFAEGKEVIGGFWIWKCASFEEAIEWAKRIPRSMSGAANDETEVEVRRVMENEDFGEEFTPEMRAQEDRLRAEMAGNA